MATQSIKPRIIEFVKGSSAKDSIVPIDIPIFNSIPQSVVFDDVVPQKPQETILLLRNVDSVSRGVKFSSESPSGITVQRIGMEETDKIAPGMDAKYSIRVLSATDEDIFGDITFTTDREVFAVSVRARSASRPMLDIPSSIDFGHSVVLKSKVSAPLLVKNIGRRPGRFVFEVSQPFSVQPPNGFLSPGESSQFTFVANPQVIGETSENLSVVFDSGDRALISLSVSAQEEPAIFLEPSDTVSFAPTFIGLSQHKQLRIVNNSAVRAAFSWKQTQSSEIGEDSSVAEKPFTSDVFQIDCISGEVWPSSHADINISFTPQVAKEHRATCFCEITGRESRIPIQLTGDAIGPLGAFNFDLLDVGEVFVFKDYHYKMSLSNKGSIAMDYSLRENAHPLSHCFKLHPTKGILQPGETQEIGMDFIIDSIGGFQFPLCFDLKGAPEPLVVTVKGSVEPPTLTFNCGEVLCGLVPFSFTVKRAITITNSSTVEVTKASLSVELDKGNSSCFKTSIENRVLPALCSTPVEFLFTPTEIGSYSGKLILRVEGIPDPIAQIPITAECQAPALTISNKLVEVGECFIGHEYIASVILENEADISARYDFGVLDTKEVTCNCVADPISGIVNAHSECKVELHLKALRLGPVRSTVSFLAAGRADVPITVTVTAIGVGPKIKPDRKELNFGKIPLFNETQKQLTLLNDSPINALLHLSIRGKQADSFHIDSESLFLNANESKVINVTALLDCSSIVSADLAITAEGSGTNSMKLIATGIGCPVICVGDSSELSKIDFGSVPTKTEVKKEVSVINKGRTPENILWSSDRKKQQQTQTQQQNQPQQQQQQQQQATVDVIPRQIVLQPGQIQTFTLTAISQVASEITEKLTCSCVESNKFTSIISPEVHVQFSDPLISIYPKKLNFSWTYSKGTKTPQIPLSEHLNLMNSSGFPLSFFLKTSVPFGVSHRGEITLQPGESKEVSVTFDPHYRGNRLSTTEENRLTVQYQGRTQRDSVQLSGVVVYPNLQFNFTEVDFGAVANLHDKKKVMTIKNSSSIEVNYCWVFERQEGTPPGKINEIFDILPIRGRLVPGESEQISFTYYGGSSITATAIASCITEGGPEYHVNLKAQSAPILYKIDKTCLDFGLQSFASTCTKEIVLQNTGAVQFAFTVNTSTVPFGRINISPMQGSVAGGARQRISVSLSPKIPEEVNDFFTIQVAQCSPEKINVIGQGIVSCLAIGIPRENDQDFVQFCSETIKPESRIGLNATEEMEAERKFMCHLFRAKHLQINQIAPSKFVLDFGSVVHGTSKRKTFKLSGFGPTNLNFDIDRNSLKGTGFSVDPITAKKLIPGQEPLTISVALDTSEQFFESKKAEVALTIRAQDSTQCIVLLRAEVIVPNLTILPSTDVDFGRILCGQSKIVTVEVLNSQDVPCQWEYQPPKPTAKDTSITAFSLSPSKMELSPGQRSQISVRFTPNLDKKYSVQLPIIISKNPNAKFIACKGIAIQPSLKIEPSTISFGPVLPKQEVITPVTLRNESDFPVEVIALGFDSKFEEEEQTLSQYKFEEGPPLIPPRGPNSSLILPPQSEEQHQVQQQQVQKTQTTAATTTSSSTNTTTTVVAAAAATTTTATTKSARRSAQKDRCSPRPITETTALTAQEPNVQSFQKMIFFVSGGPLSGKTTISKLISAKYKVPIIFLPSILESVTKVENAQQQQQQTKTENQEQQKQQEDPFITALVNRLNSEDCKKGVIIEGIDSIHLPPESLSSIVNALQEVSDSATFIAFIGLKCPFSECQARVSTRHSEEIAKHENELRSMRKLDEEEYEKLSKTERVKYDSAFKELKRIRRAALKAVSKQLQIPAIVVPPPIVHTSKFVKSARPELEPTTAMTHGISPHLPSPLNRATTTIAAAAAATQQQNQAQQRRRQREQQRRTKGKKGDLTSATIQQQDETKESANKQQQETQPEIKDPMEQAWITHEQVWKEIGEKIISTVSKVKETSGNVIEVDASGTKEETFTKLSELLPPIPKVLTTPTKDIEKAIPHIPEPKLFEVVDKKFAASLHREKPKFITLRTTATAAAAKDETSPMMASISSSTSPTLEELKKDTQRKRSTSTTVLKKREKSRDAQRVVETSKSRWTIPPKASVQISVVLCPETGKIVENLAFAIYGTKSVVSLSYDAVCEWPSIDADPRTLFYNKVKTLAPNTMAKCQYIASENLFDFGPLLIGKHSAEQVNETKSVTTTKTASVANLTATITKEVTNCAKIRLTNNGLFDVSLSMSFSSDGIHVFSVEPVSLQLSKGKSQDISVRATPIQSGLFTDNLSIEIKDNPVPLVLKMRCTGVKPSIELDKHLIAFERLLVGKTSTSTVTFKNVSMLPCTWKLIVDSHAVEFKFSQMQGTLEPMGECNLQVSYSPGKAEKIKRVFKVDISDIDGIAGILQSETVSMTAESYFGSVEVTFHKNSNGLSFGNLHVGQKSTQSLVLKNRGKFAVSCTFAVKRPDVFQINPPELELPPGEKPSSVEVTVCAQKEEHFSNDESAIVCSAVDNKTKELISTLPLKVSAQVEFVKYSISPTPTINFGPLVYGSTITRTFEITSTGIHDLKFNLIDLGEAINQKNGGGPSLAAALRLQGQRASSVVAKKKKPITGGNAGQTNQTGTGTSQPQEILLRDNPNALVLGNFAVSPMSGIIAHGGGIQKFTVEFHAGDSTASTEIIGIDIIDRDPTDNPGGIPFNLAGEVCMPTIVTTNEREIFEEQTILPNLPLVPFTRAVYAKQERILAFGVTLVGRPHKERVRIINQGKVPCSVIPTITLRPSTAATEKPEKPEKPADKKSSKEKDKEDKNAAAVASSSSSASISSMSAELPFVVEPKSLTIPANDSQFLEITFKPNAIQSYSAAFEARVESKAPLGHVGSVLSFELRGEATLPHFIIEQPTKTNSIHFHSLLVGTKETLPLVLLNDGALPATVCFDLPIGGDKVFFLPEDGKHVTIGPGEKLKTSITFTPEEAKKYAQDLRLRVEDNQFSDMNLQLSGEGFVSDVTFEDLGFENELNLGEFQIGETREMKIKMKSTMNSNAKFNWVKVPQQFQILPTSGMIQPLQTIELRVKFTAEQAMIVKSIPVTCEIEKLIEQQQPQSQTTTTTTTTTNEEQQQQQQQIVQKTKSIVQKQTGKQKVSSTSTTKSEVANEPKPTLIVTSEIKLSAKCDFAKFELSTTEVIFKPTLMLEPKVISFPLRNTGNVTLKYQWSVEFSTETCKCPFTIQPEIGSISIGNEAMINVTFLPTEAGSFAGMLSCNISNLQPGNKVPPIVLPVSGTSTQPICHFELPASNYLSHRNPELRGPTGKLGPLDPETRILEITSVGVKVKNSTSFHIVNPTKTDYDFTLERIQPGNEVVKADPFKSTVRKGNCKAGKKYELSFEFTPEELGIHESFWVLKIPHHNNYSVPLLIVGNAIEPDIAFDRAHHSFGPLIIGRTSSITTILTNSSPSSFSWSLDKTSMQSLDGALELVPSSGIALPNSKTQVVITFRPSTEKAYNWTLLFTVKHKPMKLSMNVKGEGYSVTATISSQLIDFGEVQANDQSVRVVTINNPGRYGIDFNWELQFLQSQLSAGGLISIRPEKGSIGAFSNKQCEIIFSPGKTTLSIHDAKAICRITNGPKFVLDMKGKSFRPLLHFSFLTYDFGACYLHNKNLQPKEVQLKIENRDKEVISFESSFENKAHLQASITPTSLKPGETSSIQISFLPRDSIQYREVIPFRINGLNIVPVVINGEGIEVKVEVGDEKQYKTDFGCIGIGAQITKQVKVTNGSQAPITITFAPTVLEELRSKYNISVSVPHLSLKSRQSSEIEMTFEPKSRIAPFSIPVNVEAAGNIITLLWVSGAGQGVELKLLSERETFGSVAFGSSIARTLVLRNTGDVAARFNLNHEELLPHFRITPIDGVVAPGTDTTLKLIFEPKSINSSIQSTCVIAVNGSTTPPISLNLSGQCVPRPGAMESVDFVTPVRTALIKAVTIKNKTAGVWHPQPSIDNAGENSFFRVVGKPNPEAVPAGTTATVEVEFLPMISFTSPNESYHGTLFAPLPDGEAVVIGLTGKTLAPLAAANIATKAATRMPLTIPLSVRNWLPKQQRFRVTIEKDGAVDPATTISGLDYIDVPSLIERTFKLNFLTHREGTTITKVYFKNEETKEYIWFKVVINAEAAKGAIKTLSLEAPIRQPTVANVHLENPLTTPVTFSSSCSASSEITVQESVTVPANGESSVDVIYLPLFLREINTNAKPERLSFASTELGVISFDLQLHATNPAPERSIAFVASLGTRQTQTYRFKNFSKTRADFNCSIVSSPITEAIPTIVEFEVDSGGPKSSIVTNVEADSEASVDITYEPSHEGESLATLLISSNTAGEYSVPLIGSCSAPRPQGPVNVKSGTSSTIAIRNIFPKPMTFVATIDNPLFTLKPTTELTLPPKRNGHITIHFKSTTASTARLSVNVISPTTTTTANQSSIPSQPATIPIPLPSAPWIYYIRGTI